jgi:membrane-associated protease RseP (regulator of RpoE activity)
MGREDLEEGEMLRKVAAVVLAAAETGGIVDSALSSGELEEVPRYLNRFCLSLDPGLSQSEQKHIKSLYRICDALTPPKKDGGHNKGRNLSSSNKGRKTGGLPDKWLEGSGSWLSFDGNIIQRKDVCEYFLKQLASLLDVVALETERQGIQQSFLQSTGPTSLQDLCSVRRFEPRIDYIAGELKAILDYLHVFVDGEETPVTGFALKDLRDWLVSVDADRSLKDPYTSVLQYLSWSCHASCRFCLHKNDPEGYWTRSGRWKKTVDEIKTRFKYYVPSEHALFQTQDYSFFDILGHPKILEVLRQTRKKTKGVIQFTTHGDALTRDFIEALLEFQPLFFMISLNSANPRTRKWLMNNKNPETAIQCLPILRKNMIPYAVSIVPWYENTLNDLTETILYADRNDAYLIRVNLDAYSQFFTGANRRELQSNRLKCWKKTIERVRSIRKRVQTPILFQPSLFEENLYDEAGCEAVINGVIKNSPAHRCGIRHGDIIVQIDSFVVPFKTLASNILRAYQLSNISKLTLRLKHGKRQRTVTLAEDFTHGSNGASYPHIACFPDVGNALNPFYPYGILLQETLNPKHLRDIEEIIAEHDAKNVLFLSSSLMKPTFLQVVQDTGFLRDKKVNFWIDAPQNTHFLGGSIVVGDLLVVDDYVECITNQQHPIDLVIIPSTPFGRWGRDISGKTYKEVERRTGIPVELLRCKTVANL